MRRKNDDRNRGAAGGGRWSRRGVLRQVGGLVAARSVADPALAQDLRRAAYRRAQTVLDNVQVERFVVLVAQLYLQL